MTPTCIARLACSILLLISTGLPSPASAATPLAAGFENLEAADGTEKPLAVALWYPTDAAAQAVDLGPFTFDIARGGAIAGQGLPLIVFSHGNGGSALGHHDTAIALARAGFVVAAVTHTGDNHADRSREASSMNDRPRHLRRVIDHMLTQWPGRDRIDASRIGVFGFSSGGFTVLAVAGGVADLGRIAPHCQQHPAHYACQVIARQPAGATATVTAVVSDRDARVRAAVVVAPALGFTFTQESLAAVSVPIQLWRAEDDTVLPHPWYAEAVRAGLPQPLDYREVPKAGHFDFLAPCTPRFAAMAPPLCSSQSGFDRVAFHSGFNTAVVSFFNRTLGAGSGR